MPVGIPFHIFNIGAFQDFTHLIENIFSHIFSGKIQNKLISSSGNGMSRNFQRPVRMFPVKITVLRYHLRLKPDAEFQADLIYSFYQTFQSARQLLFIYHPVSQAAVVIVSLSKPAVIHDQHLNAYFFGLSCDLQQLLCIKSKICGFPVIDQDWSSGIFEFSSADILTNSLVIISGQFSKTFS